MLVEHRLGSRIVKQRPDIGILDAVAGRERRYGGSGRRLREDGGGSETLASGLAVGAPARVRAKFLGPIGDMAGPMINFSDVTAGPDGTLHVSADAEGSVLALRAG